MSEAECPFVKQYQQAHDDAGLERVALTQLVRKLGRDPWVLNRPEVFDVAWLGLDVSAMTPNNAERIGANVLLSYLLRDFRDILRQQLEAMKAEGSGLYAMALRRPGPLDPGAREDLFAAMRSASCDAFNEIVTRWGEVRRAEYLVALKWGETPTEQSMVMAHADRFFRTAPLYREAKHNFLTLLHSGNCTALHVCWSLVEAAAYLARLPGPDDYIELILRSRKSLLPLASGSLGMVISYMEHAGLHPPEGRAVHASSHGQKAILLETGADGRDLLVLDPAYIQPFKHGDNTYYTGCPAFYVTGLIETYLEAACDLARHYQVFPELVAA